MEPEHIRTRLAPSPTGAQHIGNARTYLMSWLFARSQNGVISLRIEDIDSPRVKLGALDQALDDLRWLGLDWDGEPVVQTQRLPLYQAALDRLRKLERVYPCTCSRTDIANASSAPHAEHEGPAYPGTCAYRNSQAIPDGPFSWRFRVAHSPAFHDLFQGNVSIDLKAVGGDFVVWKNTGTPAYQLAVAVDDAAMRITHVIRGDDLLPSTPRQILIYEALQLPVPQFLHVPLVVGEDGRRLAKRHGDTRISALRDAGIPATKLLGLLAWSCGWIDRIEPVTLEELLSIFTLKSIPKSAFILHKTHLEQIGYRA